MTSRDLGALIDGDRPIRCVLRLLLLYPARLLVATLIFAIKDSPLWLMPALTAAIIDIVASHGSLPQLAEIGTHDTCWSAVAGTRDCFGANPCELP